VEGASLTVVGDGDDLPLMRRRLAADADAGRVRLEGRVDDPARLAGLYGAADVFVFPSVHDTWGQVVVEAQRAGLPVVVRDRGGPPELVRDGRTGFVTESDDAFVARVRDLVDGPGLRICIGRAAKAHADQLPGWSDVVDTLLGRLAVLAGRTLEA
jgi:glycosyltransferase involved in cell wall biosynthesis